MKVLHSADWHLRDTDIEEAEKCLEKVIEVARTEEVDLIVIAGDIFDSRDIKMESKAARLAIETISSLANIAPVAIVIGTPSHDGSAPEILRYARGEYDIYVATRPVQVHLDNGDLCYRPAGDRESECVVTLIPQPTKQYFQTGSDIKGSSLEIGAAMSALLAGFGAQASNYKAPHVLVYHGGISGARISNGQTLAGQDIEVSIEQLSLTGADVHCCGHIHLPQPIGEKTFYSGSIYAKDWGENHFHGFYIYEIKDNYLNYYFYETPTRKLARYKFDQTGPGWEVMDFPMEEVAGSMVRVDVTCWQDEATTINRDQITENLKRWGAVDVDIRLVRKPRETVRSEAVLKVETLREKLVAMAALKDETVPESILRKADELENGDPEKLIAAVLKEKVEVAG